MDLGDDNKELGRLLSCSDLHVHPKRRDCDTDLGAGANAGSYKVDMKFTAADPLSELVWSPQNGLSLRCTDCSFTNKRKLLSPFIGIGPSHEVIPLRARSHEAGFHVNFQVRTGDMSDRTRAGVKQDWWPSNEADKPSPGTGDFIGEVNPVSSLLVQQTIEKWDPIEYKMENKDDGDSIQAAEEAEMGGENSRRSLDAPRAVGESTGPLAANQTSRMEIAMNLDPSVENDAEAHEEPAVLEENGDGDKTKQANRLNVSYLEHPESMAENDLATLAGEVSKTLASEGCRQGIGSLSVDETDVEKAGLPRHSLTNSGTHRFRGKGKGKGKEKEKEKERAFSDGNLDGRTWEDNDVESFGSVESCNTAGLFSRRKKRSNFEQQLIVGSKRVKTRAQEYPGSTSRLKQDSSFMNWISNMTKGFLKASEEDKSPPVGLSSAAANDHVNRIADQHFTVCCQKEDTRCRNTGFQSIFQSIYCPKRRIQEADAELLNEACDVNATPLSCLGNIPDFQEKFLITNENRISTSDNEGGVAAEAKVSSGKVASTQLNEVDSFETKRSCKHENYLDREAQGSFSTLSKFKPNGGQKICAEAVGKGTQSLANRNNGLGSLWITRFSSRSSCLHDKDRHDFSSSEAVKCSNDCRKRIFSVDLKEANESASLMVKTHDSNMIHNPNSEVSFPKLSSSEAMASLFARRLEAMKHIMPSDLAENAEGPTILTCFYCGKRGHRLQECSEVTDTELEDLMRNINAQNRINEAFSLCIRCFQGSHWAAACPSALRQNSGTEGNKITNLGRMINYDATQFTEENQVKKHALASTSGIKLLFHDSVNKLVLDAPKEIFDAVRVLQLSRTDILKWMTSDASLSHLEGFYLRLRLGKWEEGLGGTGYHVACITGASEEQSSPKGSKNSISVTVRGMTCLVESQHISNRDFLEEELRAWWRATARSGGSLPSEEEFSRKMHQRKMLGF